MARNVNAPKIAELNMLCPRCFSRETRLNGTVRGNQRYYCIRCKYNFSNFNARQIPNFLDALLYLIASTNVEKITVEGVRTVADREERIAEIASIVQESAMAVKSRMRNQEAEQHGVKGLRRIQLYDDVKEYYKHFQISFDDFDVFLCTRRY